jgi:modulator of FtsH protease HflC
MSSKGLFSLIGLFLVLMIASSSIYIVSIYIVNQIDRAVVLRFGRLVETDVPPGIHVKIPMTDRVFRFDGRLQTADMKTESFYTIENKRLMVDSYIKWRIKDVAAYYRGCRSSRPARRRRPAQPVWASHLARCGLGPTR